MAVTDPAEVDSTAERILTSYRTFAVVGLSADPSRPSHGVAAYLQAAGYRVIPVNPTVEEVLGEKSYPDLRSIPASEGVEVVDVFRRAEQAGAVVDEAIETGAKAVWLQIGVVDDAAYERARAAGLDAVMDRCTKVEHARLVG